MGRTPRTGTQFSPANFVARFRVAARRTIQFQKRIAKKGPQYLDCNERQTSCTRAKANPRAGCPDCEFTIQRKLYVKELTEELRHLPRGTRYGERLWPVKKLLATVLEAASLGYSKEGLPGNWTVGASTLVSVYRDEMAKMKSIESFQLAQTANNTPTEKEDKDEGDFT